MTHQIHHRGAAAHAVLLKGRRITAMALTLDDTVKDDALAALGRFW